MSRRRKKSKLSKEDQLRRIYAQVPEIDCKGYCHVSCGPIGMSTLEWNRLKRAAGHTPTVVGGLTCSVLRQGRCSAYEHRPLVCRLWGVTENMPCMFGCEIISNGGKPLTIREATVLVAEVDAIGGESMWTQVPGVTRSILHASDPAFLRRPEDGGSSVVG